MAADADADSFESAAAAASSSASAPTHFTEYGISDPVIDLVQFPKRPEKYHAIKRNVWRANCSDHRLNNQGEPIGAGGDDGDDGDDVASAASSSS